VSVRQLAHAYHLVDTTVDMVIQVHPNLHLPTVIIKFSAMAVYVCACEQCSVHAHEPHLATTLSFTCLQAAAGGGEPSDAIRAVNALLTQLDQLRRFPNVMVLTTSNITEAIDVAFVDRADIKVRCGMCWD
jgi:SpoVK/Ycf46/Vps4 family AAA+-type ATPase